ncbi:MAG: membrane protein insertase YidC, partial [Candidatus Competibacterales bacterium]
MENQRFFLLVALGCVLFLIWQAWLGEQAAKRAAEDPVASAPSTPAAPGEGTAPATVPDIPARATRDAAGNVESPLPEAPAIAQGLETARRIRVTTDLFEVEIDTLGGDVRHLGLRTYPESLERQDQPFELMVDRGSQLHVAQSGLRAIEGEAPDHYQRFTAERERYVLQEGQDRLEVPLVWQGDTGVRVTKTYVFHRDRFVIDVGFAVENQSDAPWVGSQYRQLRRTPPQEGTTMFGIYTYTGGVLSSQATKYEKVSFSDMVDEDLERQITGGWIAMIQHYFLTSWIPQNQDQINTAYSRSTPDNHYILGIISHDLLRLDPGQAGVLESQLYAGPKLQDRLAAVAPNLNLTVDYGFLTIIAQPLFWLLDAIHGVVGNWGWAIVLLTVLIKAAFFKLSEASYRSMANMRRLAPQLQRLKERYGEDKQRMQQEMMNLYKQEKINPIGGCLPILVQIPVFIALYWMLLESVELRQAPWILWIQDLAVRDPFYVLPLLMGGSMFIQQQLNPAPPPPLHAQGKKALPVVVTGFFMLFTARVLGYRVWIKRFVKAQQKRIT